MDLIKTIEDLVKFKTETGNISEIKKCLDYCTWIFANTTARIAVFDKVKEAPLLFIANTVEKELDALVLGHLDVVPAADAMFEPKVEDGKMYGRGTLDMKAFAAVALNSMLHVLENKLPIKFGIILSTDEEKGSKGTEAFLEENPDLRAKIVLDNDTAGNIFRIVSKCKNPVFVKITARGVEAHGSTPWEGSDANEKLMQTWVNIRKIYPYFAKDEGGKPKDTWIDTVHFAKISGGEVANVICNESEALLDFRLTETSSVENLRRSLDKCMAEGVSFEVVSSSTPVVMSETDPHILAYKKLAEEVLGKQIEFEQIGGATDSRAFAVRGSTVIMHSGSGSGMHAAGEYVDLESVKQVAEIQIKFLENLK